MCASLFIYNNKNQLKMIFLRRFFESFEKKKQPEKSNIELQYLFLSRN